jgi:hypothetical protein
MSPSHRKDAVLRRLPVIPADDLWAGSCRPSTAGVTDHLARMTA